MVTIPLSATCKRWVCTMSCIWSWEERTLSCAVRTANLLLVAITWLFGPQSFWEHVGTTGQSGRPFGLRMELKKYTSGCRPWWRQQRRGCHPFGFEYAGANTVEQADLGRFGSAPGCRCAFFVHEAPAALAQGIGEELLPAEPLAGYAIVLVNPHCSLYSMGVSEF